MEISQNCPICNVKATQICSSCKSVKYCGVEHQKKHWKIHKNECRPFSISTANDVGRFLLATRDIKANTVIFQESSLIVGPKWYLTDKEVHIPIVPCVGCFTPITIGEHFCQSCRWPACSPNCSGLTNPKLHGLECAVLCLGSSPTYTGSVKSIMDYYRTDALIALKCLMLQQKFPKKWLQLIDMQSHEKDRLGSELYIDAENRIVSYLQENYLQKLKDLEAKTKKEILPKNNISILHKICGIIETNYMLINLPNGMDLTGIFYTACMMEHSCQPNCYFDFNHNDGFKISVIAGRDIKKGEHLKIMYSNMLWGTLLRQEHLQMTKHFICKCDRCKDPTELGTYLSAFKCMGNDTVTCENGIQLPEDPLNQNSDWKCNKCETKTSGEEVRYLLTQMGEEVDNLLSKKPNIMELEDLINKLSNFLHKNHYHLFNLKHSLIQLYGNNENHQKNHNDENHHQTIDENLKHKIQMCNDLYEICSTLDPYTIRLSLYVGIILYEKHMAIMKLNKKHLENSTDAKTEDKMNALKQIENARNLLLKANDVLKKEIDTSNGLKLSETVTKAITKIDTLISNYS